MQAHFSVRCISYGSLTGKFIIHCYWKMFFIPIFCALLTGGSYSAAGQSYIVVDKGLQKLTVYGQDGREVAAFPVAVGTNYGQKQQTGDCKTPEGTFLIKSIEASQDYHYDFGDGRGLVKGAYGPRFIRLDVPGNTSIGIHGTLPEHQGSIPGRESHGCVRMLNPDILALCRYVFKGMKVTITPDNTVTPVSGAPGTGEKIQIKKFRILYCPNLRLNEKPVMYPFTLLRVL